MDSKLNANSYLESGSIGLKCALVADGSADIFVKDVVVRDWDVAPAAVILKEVGGRLLLPDGKPFVFDGPFDKPLGVIAARDQVILDDTIKTIGLFDDI